MFRTTIALLALTTSASAVTLSNTLPVGTAVDLSGLATGVALASNDGAFTSAGIASITQDGRASSNNERYNSGSTFGAGRALFGLENGDLIALDEGAVIDFGAPEFAIDFTGLVDAFGLRIADTSNGFIAPIFTFFRGGIQIDQINFTDPFNAQTEFGFSDSSGFDRVLISTMDTDGYGITDLTVGRAVVVGPAPIPLPAGLPLMIAGVGAFAMLRRRA